MPFIKCVCGEEYDPTEETQCPECGYDNQTEIDQLEDPDDYQYKDDDKDKKEKEDPNEPGG